MAKPKEYVISVGRERIEEGYSGNLDRTSKTPVKKEVVMIPVGGYFLPSVSVAWGRRVINGKPRADKTPISATDNDYKGEIEFLKWGNPDGERIQTQYLENCNSLDKVYQEKRLNLLAEREDSSILLEQGENRFNYDSDEVKITFLKISAMNKNSTSKDPKISGFIYKEMSEKDKYNEKTVNLIEQEADALRIVRDNSDDKGVLKSLFAIMGGTNILKDVNDPKNEHQIYPALLNYAKNNPADFHGAINKHKKKLLDLFQKAEHFELMDYSIKGTIGFTKDGKKQALLNDVDAKGEDMKDWAIENCIDPTVFSAMVNFEEQLKNIK